jgi:hypothetical protein
MTTLLVTCGRCGLFTVTPAGAGIGSRCPACGDRAVDVTDLAPERPPTLVQATLVQSFVELGRIEERAELVAG